MTVFVGNIQREFPVRGVLKNEAEISGQIGDLYLEAGKPVRLVLKTERITGTVLAVRDHEIEIEGYGNVPLADNFKIYRTYGVLREQQKEDILVGYHMQEFVVADGMICAALTTEKPEIDNIRVLLMTTNFTSFFTPRSGCPATSWRFWNTATSGIGKASRWRPGRRSRSRRGMNG